MRALILRKEGELGARSRERLSDKRQARAEPWGINQIVHLSAGGLAGRTAAHGEAHRGLLASGWREQVGNHVTDAGFV